MSGFYKMDPADWDFGTSDLSLEEEAAYLRIVNAINKHDAAVPNIDRVLAGMFRCSTRKARSLVEALERAGKIYLEDGHIWNDRARSEVVHRQLTRSSRVEAGAKGGRTRAERAAKALNSNEPTQASASTRIEENREEDSDANASAAPPIDFAKAIFDNGVAFLCRHGMSDTSARSLVGKWRKDHDDSAIFSAFAEAKRAGVTDPRSYIAKLLKPDKGCDLDAAFARINPDGTLKSS